MDIARFLNFSVVGISTAAVYAIAVLAWVLGKRHCLVEARQGTGNTGV